MMQEKKSRFYNGLDIFSEVFQTAAFGWFWFASKGELVWQVYLDSLLGGRI